MNEKERTEPDDASGGRSDASPPVPRLPAGRLTVRLLAFLGILCVLLAVAIIPLGMLLRVGQRAPSAADAEGSESAESVEATGAAEPAAFEMRIDDPAIGAIEVAAFAAVLLATALAKRRLPLSWTQVGFSRSGAVWELALGFATGLASFALVPIVAQKLGWATISLPTSGASPLDSLFPALLLLLFAGAFEEVAIRGFPLTLLAARSVPLAILLTSAVFALLHLPNPSAGPMAALGVFVPGVVLAIARLRTGALWIPIGWHLGWNLSQGWLFGCAVSGTPPARAPLLVTRFDGPPLFVGGAFGPESGLLAVGADLVTLAVFVALVRGPGSRGAR